MNVKFLLFPEFLDFCQFILIILVQLGLGPRFVLPLAPLFFVSSVDLMVHGIWTSPFLYGLDLLPLAPRPANVLGRNCLLHPRSKGVLTPI
jgi:hypothetical protein